jgi:hypothetical protein
MASVSNQVPTELLVQVLVGQLPEDVAIERGRRAALAASETKRRAILFNLAVEPPTTSPALAYRPCIPPPWGEP